MLSHSNETLLKQTILTHSLEAHNTDTLSGYLHSFTVRMEVRKHDRETGDYVFVHSGSQSSAESWEDEEEGAGLGIAPPSQEGCLQTLDVILWRLQTMDTRLDNMETSMVNLETQYSRVTENKPSLQGLVEKTDFIVTKLEAMESKVERMERKIVSERNVESKKVPKDLIKEVDPIMSKMRIEDNKVDRTVKNMANLPEKHVGVKFEKESIQNWVRKVNDARSKMQIVDTEQTDQIVTEPVIVELAGKDRSEVADLKAEKRRLADICLKLLERNATLKARCNLMNTRTYEIGEDEEAPDVVLEMMLRENKEMEAKQMDLQGDHHMGDSKATMQPRISPDKPITAASLNGELNEENHHGDTKTTMQSRKRPDKPIIASSQNGELNEENHHGDTMTTPQLRKSEEEPAIAASSNTEIKGVHYLGDIEVTKQPMYKSIIVASCNDETTNNGENKVSHGTHHLGDAITTKHSGDSWSSEMAPFSQFRERSEIEPPKPPVDVQEKPAKVTCCEHKTVKTFDETTPYSILH